MLRNGLGGRGPSRIRVGDFEAFAGMRALVGQVFRVYWCCETEPEEEKDREDEEEGETRGGHCWVFVREGHIAVAMTGDWKRLNV